MIVGLDLETTGLDKDNDKIIEVALVLFDEKTFEIKDTFSTLINPGENIPEFISNITNIYDEDVKNAPILDSEMIQKIKDFIGEHHILGHNVFFDIDFLEKIGINLKNNLVIDTFLLANFIFYDEKSLNLGNLCDKLNIELKLAHRALDDTKGSIFLFEELIKKLKNLKKIEKNLLSYIFSLGNHKEFKFILDLCDFDDKIEDEAYFVKNLLKIIGKYIKKEDEIEEDYKENYDIRNIFDLLSFGEKRENQIKLSEKIDEVLKEDKKIVIEAPTGLGKTFAYLIPAIFYSKKYIEKVYISTNTKILQDQIFFKDLKFLKENLGIDFSYTKLKGKKNYFSIFRYFEYLGNFNPNIKEDIFFLSKILLWLFHTKSGELDELNILPNEYIYLNDLNGDNFIIFTEENDYKEYEFFLKARKKAQNSDIIIINHSLLAHNILSDQGIVGEIKNLIIDEGHNLEDTLSTSLEKKFSLQNLADLKNKIFKNLKKYKFNLKKPIENTFDKILLDVSYIFDILDNYSIKKNNFSSQYFDVLIEKDFFEEHQNLADFLVNIDFGIKEILESFDEIKEKKNFLYFKTDLLYLDEIKKTIKNVFDEKLANKYIQVFTNKPNQKNYIYYTVLNCGEFLKENIWNTIDSLVILSATIKINNSFNYIKNTLSLEDFNDFISYESEFDYKKQALLFVPNNLGSTRYDNPLINDFVLQFLKRVKGKTLILFTSFSSIKNLYLSINNPLKQNGINVLAQGVGGNKYKITNNFIKNSSNSIILGTSSFWEGIDIPGDDLKYLIIHKFPFMVPSDPIFKARSKLYNNPFLEYSIPKAILKTKQGFGRLIRTKNDTGVVLVLDDRFFTKEWGKIMKESFPSDINIKIGDPNNFLEIIEQKQKIS